MAQSREDRIVLAYKAVKASYYRGGYVDRVHALSVVDVGRKFNMSPLTIQQIVNARRDDKRK